MTISYHNFSLYVCFCCYINILSHKINRIYTQMHSVQKIGLWPPPYAL